MQQRLIKKCPECQQTMEGEMQAVPTELDLPLFQKLNPYSFMPEIMKNITSIRYIYALIVGIYKYF